MARHATNHLALSRKIFDPVAAIATDGAEVSSALRNDYINRAIGFVRDYVYSAGRFQTHLQGLIKVAAAQTFSAYQSAVPTDYAYPLYLYDADGYKCRYIMPEEFVTAVETKNPNFINVFSVYNGYIHATTSTGAVRQTGVCTFGYIGTGQLGTSDTTPEIDAIWDNIIVDLAASYHFEDKGQFDYAEGQKRRAQMVLSVIGNG